MGLRHGWCLVLLLSVIISARAAVRTDVEEPERIKVPVAGGLVTRAGLVPAPLPVPSTTGFPPAAPEPKAAPTPTEAATPLPATPQPAVPAPAVPKLPLPEPAAPALAAPTPAVEQQPSAPGPATGDTATAGSVAEQQLGERVAAAAAGLPLQQQPAGLPYKLPPPGLNADRPVTIADLRPVKENAFRRDFYYMVPEQPRAVALLIHGCAHSGRNYWPQSDVCPECRGLPEEMSHMVQALRRGYAVIAVNSLDQTTGCWSWQEDCDDVRDLMRTWMRQHNLQGLPLYGLGVSSGSAFILKLPRYLIFSGLVSEALAVTVDSWGLEKVTKSPYPPTVFVSMLRDEEMRLKISTAWATLHQLGVPVSVIGVHPRQVYPTYFSDRFGSMITPALSIKITAALHRIRMLDANGFVLANPRYTTQPWLAQLQDQVPEMAGALLVNGDHVLPEYQGTEESALVGGVWSLMCLAYAEHEIISDYTTAAFLWFESGATANIVPLIRQNTYGLPPPLPKLPAQRGPGLAAQPGRLVPAKRGPVLPAHPSPVVPAKRGPLLPARQGPVVPAKQGLPGPARQRGALEEEAVELPAAAAAGDEDISSGAVLASLVGAEVIGQEEMQALAARALHLGGRLDGVDAAEMADVASWHTRWAAARQNSTAQGDASPGQPAGSAAAAAAATSSDQAAAEAAGGDEELLRQAAALEATLGMADPLRTASASKSSAWASRKAAELAAAKAAAQPEAASSSSAWPGASWGAIAGGLLAGIAAGIVLAAGMTLVLRWRQAAQPAGGLLAGAMQAVHPSAAGAGHHYAAVPAGGSSSRLSLIPGVKERFVDLTEVVEATGSPYSARRRKNTAFSESPTKHGGGTF